MNNISPSRSCGLATWSLVLGIFALVLCPIGLLFGIPALICGHKALGRIKQSGGALQGNGLATAGLVMGYLSVALSMMLAALSVIAIPNFVKARQAAQQNSCINNLRVLDGAKEQWALEKSRPAGTQPTEADIAAFLPGATAMPTCPARGTYELHAIGESPTCSQPGHELPE